MRARIFTLFPFVGAACAILLLPVPFSGVPATREVDVRADQYAFHPSVLRVNQGDRLVLNIQATDVVHGWYLDDYGIDVRVEPGISQQINFVADKTGKYRYRCSVACGALHPFMLGELVVSPNRPFGRAVGLSLVTLVGTLVYLWRFPPKSQQLEQTSSLSKMELVDK